MTYDDGWRMGMFHARNGIEHLDFTINICCEDFVDGYNDAFNIFSE